MRNQNELIGSLNGISHRSSFQKPVREFSPNPTAQSTDLQIRAAAQNNNKDYGQYILEQAPRAFNRIHEYLGKNVIGNLGIFTSGENEAAAATAEQNDKNIKNGDNHEN